MRGCENTCAMAPATCREAKRAPALVASLPPARCRDAICSTFCANRLGSWTIFCQPGPRSAHFLSNRATPGSFFVKRGPLFAKKLETGKKNAKNARRPRRLEKINLQMLAARWAENLPSKALFKKPREKKCF